MMSRLVAALTMAIWATAAPAACRQALVLGLDVSGSVDRAEYTLQINGLANALLHPEVTAALLTMPDAPVRLAVFIWSGPESQSLIVPWSEIRDAAALAAVAARLRAAARPPGDPSTAIGAAMMHGAGLLADQQGCWKRTIDISGDGKSNTGPHPRDARRALAPGITVNGLVIGADNRPEGDRRMMNIAELASYFQAYVVHGPDAFVETALGFADFEAAMVRKLKRELEGLVLSSQ